jgi:hypothetical protein
MVDFRRSTEAEFQDADGVHSFDASCGGGSHLKRLHAIGRALLFAGIACDVAQAAAHHVTPASMDTNSRELFQESMTLGDQAWDKSTKLISTGGVAAHESVAIRYMVRESSWYAFGLLVRDGKGDRQRAAEILAAVLKEQYLVPNTRWYGPSADRLRRPPLKPMR